MGKQFFRQLVAITIVLMLSVSVVGCGGKDAKEPDSQEFEFADSVTIDYVESKEVKTINSAVTYLLVHFLEARVKTEEFVYESDESAMARIDELAELWERAEEAYLEAEEIIDATVVTAEGSDGRAYHAALPDARAVLTSLLMPQAAYAAKKGSLEWAEELDSKFSNIRAADKYKELAEYLGTDIRGAIKGLEEAQRIIRDSSLSSARKNELIVNSLDVLKTSGKVSFYYLTSFVAAPIASVGGVVGAAAGGVDCLIDVAETGAKVFMGESSGAALAIDKVKDKISPVTSIIGVATLDAKKILGGAAKETLDGLVYLGDSVISLWQEGKIMGFKVFKGSSGTKIEVGEVKTEGKPEEESKPEEKPEKPGEEEPKSEEIPEPEEPVVEEPEPAEPEPEEEAILDYGPITMEEMVGIWSGTGTFSSEVDITPPNGERTYEVVPPTRSNFDALKVSMKDGGIMPEGFADDFSPVKIGKDGKGNSVRETQSGTNGDRFENVMRISAERRGAELHAKVYAQVKFHSHTESGVYTGFSSMTWEFEMKKEY